MPEIKNLEAEQAVLGCLLYEGELIKECRLKDFHFSLLAHQEIFKAMRLVDKKDIPLDAVALTTELGNGLGNVGGGDYLYKLVNAVPTISNFNSYQRMVIESHHLRRGHHLASTFLLDPSEESMNRLHFEIGELQEQDSKTERTMKDIMVDIYDDLENDRGDLTGADTGFIELNAMTSGLQDGELVIVAARPSVGKTTFALNMALSHCESDGVTDVFSLETPDKRIGQLCLSILGDINRGKWQNSFRRFNERDFVKNSNAMAALDNLDLYIHDLEQGIQTVGDIRSHVRQTKKKHPNKRHMVIIDYLQLLSPIKPRQNRNLEVADMTRELKKMAMEFHIPIVLLSQLSRGVESRQDKRPMMSDLRDSGAVEQDADVIMFLYRDDYYDKSSEKANIVEVIISKQRNGPVGTIDLAFIKEYGKFLDIYRKHKEANST